MEPITSFKGEHRFLSNFYPARVVLHVHIYPTVEHAYQAGKCDGFTAYNKQLLRQIRSCELPGTAKALGRKAILLPDWATERVKLMQYLVSQKFASGTHLADELLQTEDRELIEGNTWGDVFWGVCKGIGENNLGKILMRRRKWLQEHSSSHYDSAIYLG